MGSFPGRINVGEQSTPPLAAARNVGVCARPKQNHRQDTLLSQQGRGRGAAAATASSQERSSTLHPPPLYPPAAAMAWVEVPLAAESAATPTRQSTASSNACRAKLLVAMVIVWFGLAKKGSCEAFVFPSIPYDPYNSGYYIASRYQVV